MFDPRYAKVERIKAILVAVGRGGHRRDSETLSEYKQLRGELIQDQELAPMVPDFLKHHRTFLEFWGFIQPKFSTYKERTEFIAAGFQNLLSYLEKSHVTPVTNIMTAKLNSFNREHLSIEWQKALVRAKNDIDGAITMARTLLESTLKHILDEAEISYDPGADLIDLYKLVCQRLNLAPSLHTEQIYKQILSGCHSVVQGIGAVRSKLGDAHGKGKGAPKPELRHAELSINLSGAVTLFLMDTWRARAEERKNHTGVV